MPSLDLMGAVSSGWVSFMIMCAFTFTDKKQHFWLNMPWWVRLGLYSTATAFMIRSVNLFTIMTSEPPGPGRVNLWGLLTQIALAYTATAFVVWGGFFNRLPRFAWVRLRLARDEIKHGGKQFVVSMNQSQLEAFALARGATINAIRPEDVDIIKTPLAVVPEKLLKDEHVIH